MLTLDKYLACWKKEKEKKTHKKNTKFDLKPWIIKLPDSGTENVHMTFEIEILKQTEIIIGSGHNAIYRWKDGRQTR